MRQSTISIRVDQGLKNSFDSLCEAFGLTATAAFNIFMKAVVRERKIPFEIKADDVEMVRSKAMDAFFSMRKAAVSSGDADMSLEVINSEIEAVRNERR